MGGGGRGGAVAAARGLHALRRAPRARRAADSRLRGAAGRWRALCLERRALAAGAYARGAGRARGAGQSRATTSPSRHPLAPRPSPSTLSLRRPTPQVARSLFERERADLARHAPSTGTHLAHASAAKEVRGLRPAETVSRKAAEAGKGGVERLEARQRVLLRGQRAAARPETAAEEKARQKIQAAARGRAGRKRAEVQKVEASLLSVSEGKLLSAREVQALRKRAKVGGAPPPSATRSDGTPPRRTPASAAERARLLSALEHRRLQQVGAAETHRSSCLASSVTHPACGKEHSCASGEAHARSASSRRCCCRSVHAAPSVRPGLLGRGALFGRGLPAPTPLPHLPLGDESHGGRSGEGWPRHE